MNRYWRKIYTGLILLGLVFAGCAPRATPAASGQFPIKVCYSALTATQVPVLYAYDKGLFANHGLAVELIYIESGTTAATAMIAGEVAICQVAGSSVVSAAVVGEDLVFVGGLFNTYVYSLLVDPEVLTPEDLRGKAVAVSRIGSSSDAAMRAALTHFGLQPDKDVAILEIGDQDARIAAMASHQIAGTVASIPASAIAKEQGFRVLLDMSTLNIPYQHTAVATTRSYIASNRAQVVAFMQALTDALGLIRSDREGTKAVIAKYLQLDPVQDAGLLSDTYDELIPEYLPEVPYPTLEGIQLLLDQLEPQNPQAASFTASQLVDLSILGEIGFKPPTPVAP